MTTFVDTTAIFALLDADDANHADAASWFAGPGRTERLVSHSYVIGEAAALVQQRLGPAACHRLVGDLLPVIEVAFVEESLHRMAVAAWLTAGSKRLSLVDCVSFELVRSRRIDRAFAFDDNFLQHRIPVVPAR